MAKRVISDEFKAEVVAVALQSESTQQQIADDFGVSKTALTAWLRKAREAEASPDGVAPAEKVSVEKKEYRELLKRCKLLEQEAEVMRRAVGYLSAGVNPK